MIRRLALLATFLPSLALAQAPPNTFLASPPPSGLQPQACTALCSSLVLKAAPGSFYAVNADVGTTAGKLVLIDSATVPASGAAITPVVCGNAPASNTASIGTNGGPADRMQNGIVVLFTTGGCFTYTPSATVTISGGQAQ